MLGCFIGGELAGEFVGTLRLCVCSLRHLLASPPHRPVRHRRARAAALRVEAPSGVSSPTSVIFARLRMRAVVGIFSSNASQTSTSFFHCVGIISWVNPYERMMSTTSRLCVVAPLRHRGPGFPSASSAARTAGSSPLHRRCGRCEQTPLETPRTPAHEAPRTGRSFPARSTPDPTPDHAGSPR